MKIKHGDVQQFIYGGREFAMKGDGSGTIELPGLMADVNPGASESDVFVKQSRKLGVVKGFPVGINNERNDLEFLRDIAKSAESKPLSITLIDGVTYSGDMYINGAVEYTTGDGTTSPEFRGAKLEQI